MFNGVTMKVTNVSTEYVSGAKFSIAPGQTKEAPDDIAQRFIKRGWFVEVKVTPPATIVNTPVIVEEVAPPVITEEVAVVTEEAPTETPTKRGRKKKDEVAITE